MGGHMSKKYDFAGWATKCGILCSDGRTIEKNAFKENSGKTVPLVWMHQHNDPNNVLGHVLLENRDEGVFAYGTFNDTESGQLGKKLVQNGDITSLSIYANKLIQNGGNVTHGEIREVSLVLAGANPGASIIFPVLAHGEEAVDEATIYNDSTLEDAEENIDDEPEEMEDSDDEVEEYEDDESETEEDEEVEDKLQHADGEEKTVKDVLDTLNEEQKNAVYYMLGAALEEGQGAEDEDEYEEDEEVKHNVFDNDAMMGDALSHDAMETIIGDAKKYGSLKESVLAHAEDYGIDGIEWLFPEDRNVNGNTPEFLKREDSWVNAVMNGVHHTPFSRIKSTYADLTEDEARAKGYIKTHMKKEEVFSLLKRSTSPQTIYKKQKLDRDDQIDITDFDVVAWLKGEMRMMLDEEIARAVLIGDGRLASDDDKISEDHVRPIANDADLFTIKANVQVPASSTDPDAKAKAFIKAAIKARKDYKGSGNPTLFTTEDMLTDMLLIEDTTGRAIYETETALATKLRVKNIVTVPVMENHTVGGVPLLGIIVNMNDYNVGADKGGEINMFDDFDIDYNQMKYLIETRISGALVKPYSAIVLFEGTAPESVDGDVKRSKTIHTTPTTGGDNSGNGE